MTLMRKATILGIGLTLLGAILDSTGRDSDVETAAEVVMLAKVFGSAAPASAGPQPASVPQSSPLDRLLGR